MTVQIVEIAGQKIAILPEADYERLVDIAEDRAGGTAAASAAARRESGEEYLPAELVDRIMAGESALKVWRQYRGSTQDELADLAGCGKMSISQQERGAGGASLKVWRALAEALRVGLDDIVPVR